MHEIVTFAPNSDLHNHTRGSDGRQSSIRFLLRASRSKKNIIAMADHDSVQGYKNLEDDLYAVVEIAKESTAYDPTKLIEMLEGIKILKGTELITSYNGVIIEVLGYNFDVDKMQEEISRLKTTVKQKPYEALYEGFCKIIEGKGLVFDKSVLDSAYRKIKEQGKGGVVGPFFNELIAHEENLHLLSYLDENGEKKQANTLKLFINKHLYNRESPLFVDMSQTRPSYQDTIAAIHRAGGKAVLAHAGRYNDKLSIRDNIDGMISQGLDGLEVYYPDHSDEMEHFLLGKVREYGLIASGGSDDHHSIIEGVQYDIGRVAIPDIPETSWIKESVVNGADFLRDSEKMRNAIQQLKKLKIKRDELRKQKEELAHQVNTRNSNEKNGEKEYE